MAAHPKFSNPTAKRIGVREFRGNFSTYMRQVRTGASFIVTSRGEAVAIIQPPDPPARPLRQAEALRGDIWMAPDFDTLPSDILACMDPVNASSGLRPVSPSPD